jgi:hypothetical protein
MLSGLCTDQCVHTIIGIEPHIIVIGMPQLIMRVIMSQHILSMSMLIMPVGIIMHIMPWPLISHVMAGNIGIPQQLIIGIPAHIIMHGVPFFIMVESMLHMSFIISIVAPSPGIIMHFMPLSVMVQVMRQFIGIIIAMGIDIGIADIPIGFIIGFIAALFIGYSKRVITGDTKLMLFCARAQPYEISMIFQYSGLTLI